MVSDFKNIYGSTVKLHENLIVGVPDSHKIIIYFAQTTTLQHFLVALGVAKDYQPLTADNYEKQNRRQWFTANLTPFAGNVVAVLYQCVFL